MFTEALSTGLARKNAVNQEPITLCQSSQSFRPLDQFSTEKTRFHWSKPAQEMPTLGVVEA